MDKIGSTVFLVAAIVTFVCGGFVMGATWALSHVAKG